MALRTDYYSRSPEAILVGLAGKGDRNAFTELVERRQIWIRNLMRRCCSDVALADDLAQQVFLQAWRKLPQLQRPERFGGWLKRLAINTWLQPVRKNDPIRGAAEYEDTIATYHDAANIAMDLDRALATLPHDARLCIVLSYHEGMTHDEISEFTNLPVGTVKSHIRRGTQQLQQQLSVYENMDFVEE